VSDDIMKATLNERIMDHWAVSNLIDCAGGKRGNQKTKAKLLDELKAVAADLAGPSPSPIETMLAEAAATTDRLYAPQTCGPLVWCASLSGRCAHVRKHKVG
jgi:hypothetical protein